MSNEEAINILLAMYGEAPLSDDEDGISLAVQMAINALEQQDKAKDEVASEIENMDVRR